MKKESDLEQIKKNLMDQANLQASIRYDDFAASRKINSAFRGSVGKMEGYPDFSK
jgi:hypothetical protein